MDSGPRLPNLNAKRDPETVSEICGSGTAAPVTAAQPERGTGADRTASITDAWTSVFAAGRQVTIGQVVDRLADRGFGVLLVTLALPTLIPVLPPGTAALTGIAYVTLAIQMLSGAQRPWVPQRLRNVRLSPRATAALRALGVHAFGRVTRVARERAWYFRDHVYASAVAVVVLFLGLVLLTPMPFLNTLPAIAVMLLGFGLLNRDGLLVIAGMLVAAAVAVVVAFGAGTLYVFVKHIGSVVAARNC